MTAADPWAEATAARLPAAGLAAFAAVRAEPGVRVFPAGADVWVTWPAGRAAVARAAAGAAGGRLFACRGGAWFPVGSRLPAAGPPAGDGSPLAGVVVPGRLAAAADPADPPTPAIVTLVRGGPPRPATALLCRVTDLKAWADTATADDLAGATAAATGPRWLVRGRLPPTPAGERFAGDTVLVPLGFTTAPAAADGVIRAAVGVAAGDVLLLTPAGAVVVPAAAFGRVTRAGLRAAGAA